VFIVQQASVRAILAEMRNRLPTLRFTEERQRRFFAFSIIEGMIQFERPRDPLATISRLERQVMAFPSQEGRRYLRSTLQILSRGISRRRHGIPVQRRLSEDDENEIGYCGAARLRPWVRRNLPGLIPIIEVPVPIDVRERIAVPAPANRSVAEEEGEEELVAEEQIDEEVAFFMASGPEHCPSNQIRRALTPDPDEVLYRGSPQLEIATEGNLLATP
jgi:hypothetical protein